MRLAHQSVNLTVCRPASPLAAPTLLCLAPAHALNRLTSASLPKLPNSDSTSLASAVGGTLAKKSCAHRIPGNSGNQQV